MASLVLQLIGTLIIILIAAEIFTNALEHLGEELKISDGVTGSIFAAVGTALPETMVPLLALLTANTHVNVSHEIGVGAILGAPLMLSTLSTGLMAAAVVSRRGLKGKVKPEPGGLKRDLNFFLFAFFLAGIAMFVPADIPYLRALISLSLLLCYFLYLLLTIQASQQLVAEGHGTESDHPMFLKRLGFQVNRLTIAIQLIIGLGLLILGARGFIHGIEATAQAFGVSVLLLSLLIIPIATELPEKINSILWIRRNKDTLAFGNISGAMVFQGTLLPAIGIMLTPWVPRIEVLTGMMITLAAAAWLRFWVKDQGLPIWALLLNIILYLTYLLLMLSA